MASKHPGVFRTKEGWRVVVYMPDGRVVKRRAKDLDSAIAKRRDLELQRDAARQPSRTHFDRSSSTGAYLTAYAARPGLAANTAATYDLYAKYLARTRGLLWTKALGEVSTDDVSAAYVYLARMIGEQTGERLSPGTLDGIRRFVSSGFGRAVRDRLIQWNPATYADGMPKYRKPEPDPPNRADMRRILDELAGHRLGGLFVVAAYCGLRIGEAIALTDGALRADDDGRPLLWVGHGISDRDPVDLVSLGLPKGEKTRTIGLPRTAAQAIEAAIAQRDADARKAGDRWAGRLGLIFATRRGTRLGQHYLNDLLQDAARRAGYPKPIAFHDLRRFTATAILESGGSMDDVGLVLGHSDARVTARYTAVTNARRAAVAERLAAWLEASETVNGGTD
jgi:integrase